MKVSDFPDTLYVHQTIGTDDGDAFLAHDDLSARELEDGVAVAVYELRHVKQMKITCELVRFVPKD